MSLNIQARMMFDTLKAICETVGYKPDHTKEFTGDILEEKIKDLVKENKELKDKFRYFSYCLYDGIKRVENGDKYKLMNEFVELCKKLEIVPYCWKIPRN